MTGRPDPGDAGPDGDLLAGGSRREEKPAGARGPGGDAPGSPHDPGASRPAGEDPPGGRPPGLPEHGDAATPLPIDGTLDLHTFRPGEVKELVRDYVEACREKGILEIRIIHGKGTGTLKAIVESVLSKLPGVVAHRQAGHGGGGWGATVATLSPPDRTGPR